VSEDVLKIGQFEFRSRLFTGTGKYPDLETAKNALLASACEVVTVAVRRVDLKATGADSIMTVLREGNYTLLPNTAGCYTAEDAVRAGFASREALVAYLGELGPLEPATEVYRVELHHGGDGDRVELALEDTLTPDDIALIRAKLARMDRDGAWTTKTLGLIEQHPRTAASKLAVKVKRETLPFKTDVRKLKKLGLTQSFEVGYEISPRGRAYLAATRVKRKPRPASRRRA